jgi:hypothetical protein
VDGRDRLILSSPQEIRDGPSRAGPLDQQRRGQPLLRIVRRSSGAVDRAFTRRYFAAAGRSVAAPWSIAVGGNFDYPDTQGPKPFGTDLLNRYPARATVAAQHDDTVALLMNEGLALVRRAEWLFSPGFMLRVLLKSRRPPSFETPRRTAALHR